jgi:hypothetical protein
MNSQLPISDATTIASEVKGKWYQGKYPLHRLSPICLQADSARRKEDLERQNRDHFLLEKWPRVSGDTKLRLLKEGDSSASLCSIPTNLNLAIDDLRHLLSLKRLCPTGQDAHWYKQVLAFLCVQISDISLCGGKSTRFDLSNQVARHSLKKYTAERIREHECLWVKYHIIPENG